MTPSNINKAKAKVEVEPPLSHIRLARLVTGQERREYNMYYELCITETAKNSLKEEASQIFNEERLHFKSLEEIKQHLIERYGSLPKRTITNTIYQNPDAAPVGFLRSFWNKDWSHNTKSWWQTDWVVVSTVQKQPILVN